MNDEETKQRQRMADLAREVNWALEDYASAWTVRLKSFIITSSGEIRRIGDVQKLNDNVRAAKLRLSKACQDLDEYKEMLDS